MSTTQPGADVGAGSTIRAALDAAGITTAGAKRTEGEQRALTSDLQRTLEGTL